MAGCVEDFPPGTAGELAQPLVEGDEDASTQRERRRDVQNIQGPREGAGGKFCGEFPGFMENCGEVTGRFFLAPGGDVRLQIAPPRQ